MKYLIPGILSLGAVVFPMDALAHKRHHHINHHFNHHGHLHRPAHPRNPNRCHWHPNKGIGHCHGRNVHGPRPYWYPPHGIQFIWQF